MRVRVAVRVAVRVREVTSPKSLAKPCWTQCSAIFGWSAMAVCSEVRAG